MVYSPYDIDQEQDTTTPENNNLIDVFKGSGLVAVEKWQYGQNHYRLGLSLGNNLLWILNFDWTTNAGGTGKNIHAIQEMGFGRGLICKDENTFGGIVFGGSGWSAPAGQVPATGLVYHRSNTTGDYCQFTTPAGMTMVGFRGYVGINAGIILITIDGDRTLANRCKTAQDLVDDGEAANTILVANGGTLNPTDRVVNLYREEDYSTILLSDNLTAGAHVVRLTVTGYFDLAGSSPRLYVDDVCYSSTSTLLSDTDVHMVEMGRATDWVSPGQSTFEYSLNTIPSGAVNAEWIGNRHGNDNETDLEIIIDWTEVSLGYRELSDGGYFQITRTSEFSHTEIDGGGTVIGTCVSVYTGKSEEGLKIETNITWLRSGVYSNSTYPAMLPTDEHMDRARLEGSSSTYTLTSDDDSAHGLVRSVSGWSWDQDGQDAALCWLPEVAQTMRNWTYTTTYTWWQDRVGGILNKLYFTRNSNDKNEPIVVGSGTRFVGQYMVNKISNAEAILSVL